MKSRILKSIPLVLIAALGLAGTATVSAEVDPDAIVKSADEIRFPAEPFQISVKVTNHVPDGEPKEYEYQVLQKGFEKSVVRTMAPASRMTATMRSSTSGMLSA